MKLVRRRNRTTTEQPDRRRRSEGGEDGIAYGIILCCLQREVMDVILCSATREAKHLFPRSHGTQKCWKKRVCVLEMNAWQFSSCHD
jgi:hypothetical protein